jgi:predicted DNA-binding transcriptional regulator AlpA
MTDECDNPFLTIEEAAAVLRVKRRTLDNLRWAGNGPKFRRHGGRIVYHRDELLEWSEQRRARVASELRQPQPQPRSGHARSRPLAHNGAMVQDPALALEREP